MNRYGYSSKLWSQPIATNKYKIIVYLVEVQDRALGTYVFWLVQNEFVIFQTSAESMATLSPVSLPL